MKVKLKSWVEYGNSRDVGYNAHGYHSVMDVTLNVQTLDEIPTKLKANGIEFTGYRVLSTELE